MEGKRKIVLLMGRKLGMTQIHDDRGNFVAATAIEVGPCPVVCMKTAQKDGYGAIQIAAEEVAPHRLTSAVAGHFAKNNCRPHRHLKELRVDAPEAYAAGENLSISLLGVGDRVDVSGITKGCGFQGVMKRYGFSGGPASHGSMFHRRGGSYGQREKPGRVYPGRKMPGPMGDEKRTMQNLAVVRVIPEKNLLFVRGSIVGANGGLVTVRTAKKG
jgi:large subunit ribosomal protein L3